MAQNTKGVPQGFHTVTASVTVKDAARAIEFYKRAFGAQEAFRIPGPDGKSVMHAELRIGDSPVMVGEEMPGMGPCASPQSLGGTTSSLYLYVEDADRAFKQAVDAGCTVGMPVTDMFWGDRLGQLVDPFGHSWGVATHLKDVTPAEMEKGAKEMYAQMGSH